MDSITNLANHDINDDYDEDFFMLDTINASERSQSKDGYDDDKKLGETDQRIGDYTWRHSLPSGYNLCPHVSSRSNVFRNDNKNDGDDELSERGESRGYVDNDDGADKSMLGYAHNKNDSDDELSERGESSVHSGYIDNRDDSDGESRSSDSEDYTWHSEDYTRRHLLPRGYNLHPQVSSRSNVLRNDNKNDSDDESIDRGESSGCVDNDYGADESALLPSGACPIFKKMIQV